MCAILTYSPRSTVLELLNQEAIQEAGLVAHRDWLNAGIEEEGRIEDGLANRIEYTTI